MEHTSLTIIRATVGHGFSLTSPKWIGDFTRFPKVVNFFRHAVFVAVFSFTENFMANFNFYLASSRTRKLVCLGKQLERGFWHYKVRTLKPKMSLRIKKCRTLCSDIIILSVQHTTKFVIVKLNTRCIKQNQSIIS